MKEYPSQNIASTFEYDAFISYRTSMIPDGPVGEELQKVLESYPVPKALSQHIVKPKRFRSRLKVFRDTTDLSAGGNLGEAIKQQLRASRWLIVVCSPNTPQSNYCNEEVRYFGQYHGDGRVLFLLIAGEPHESFPLASIGTARGVEASAANGESEQIPLGADVRAADVKGIVAKLRGRRILKEKQERFKILAPLLGCDSPDNLIRRHRARVRHQIQQVVLTVLLVSFGVSWIIADRIRQERIRTEAEQLLAGMGLEDNLTDSEVDGLWKLGVERAKLAA